MVQKVRGISSPECLFINDLCVDQYSVAVTIICRTSAGSPLDGCRRSRGGSVLLPAPYSPEPIGLPFSPAFPFLIDSSKVSSNGSSISILTLVEGIVYIVLDSLQFFWVCHNSVLILILIWLTGLRCLKSLLKQDFCSGNWLRWVP